MKVIQLTRGQKAFVDDEDYERVSKWRWSYHHTGYAVRGKPQINMHRFILNALKGQWIDHKNGNKLDNRRLNLRFCTNRQNQYNSVPRRSIPKGIYWRANRKAWVVRVKRDGVRVYVGYFKDFKDARKACAKAVKTYHGEFARIYA